MASIRIDFCPTVAAAQTLAEVLRAQSPGSVVQIIQVVDAVVNDQWSPTGSSPIGGGNGTAFLANPSGVVVITSDGTVL